MPSPLDIWQQLLDDQHAPLLDAAAACSLAHTHPSSGSTLNAIARLRKQYDADLVAVALQLTDARRRAAMKFPDHAVAMLADVEGVEQASSMLVAQHKAKRFKAVASRIGTDAVFDLCSGIGGDAIALANAGLNVTAIDADPVRAFMTSHNAGCPSRSTDVESWLAELDAGDAKDAVFHIDPARRTSAGRAWNLADYTPGPAFLRQLLERIPTGAIKLGPGIHHDELADELTDGLPDFELEFISERGRLVQAVLWTGEFANAPSSSGFRSATLLPDNLTLGGHASTVGEPPIDEIEPYLFTVDPSVERAQLMDVLCEQFNLRTIHPALGLLTSHQMIASPWLTAFAFIEELPWRLKKVQAWLREHDAGIVEVKTRGKAVDPDIAQKQLRGKGDEPFTVFVLRFDEQVRAIITKRIAPSLQ